MTTAYTYAVAGCSPDRVDARIARHGGVRVRVFFRGGGSRAIDVHGAGIDVLRRAGRLCRRSTKLEGVYVAELTYGRRS